MMKAFELMIGAVLALSMAIPAAADRLDPAAVEYVGYFTFPASTSSSIWAWGTHGLTLIPDCLGQEDPSPNDGFPGCMGGFGYVGDGMFGVVDIVPSGSQAQQVVPFYALGGTLPTDTLEFPGTSQYWDVLYDKGADYCRLWWTYGTWYVEITRDPPFLGVSSCDPGNPNPQGMWDFGPEWSGNTSDDPFATAKMYGALSVIPKSLADNLLGGKQMMLGLGRHADGPVGRSQGPSLYVRDFTLPATGLVLDATPLLWYGFTNYVTWWDQPEMNGGAARHWTQAEAYGAEFVSTSSGEAVVMPWREPTINPNDYPCSDPTAYRDNDPTTPTPCEIPVCWYGVAACLSGAPDFQQPSFWENTSTGAPMPVDCNVSDTCDQYTGMHCLSMKPFLIFYDVSELSAVFTGSMQHNEPQPYAKVPLDLIGGSCVSETAGSTYDEASRLLYISQGRANPAIHVFSISSGLPPPPPPPANVAPTANAGADQVVEDSDGLPGEMITLDGSGSSDGDGSIISYTWSALGGSVSDVIPTITASAPDGTTTVTLTVTDDDGATDTDTVLITVVPALPPPPEELTLSAEQLTTLTWSGAVGAEVEIYRNNHFFITTPNDGEFIYAAPRRRKPHTYRLCEVGGDCVSATDG